ncbi:hypothetical protein FS749_005174 [Ceratobasidium sp. UAMH 11750]|nr:hypothetical protein FS749_005174 [Ceratobasidium sp. UAMH 11750]
MSRLPPEILNMIVDFSSPEARATIVNLNCWFYQTFGKMLYRDIYIRSAPQLVKLFQSPKAARNLEETWRLTIKRSVLWEASWDNICGQLKPAEYLGHVLQMTSSLREFRTKEQAPGTAPFLDLEYEYLFTSEISRLALNPSFLPHLARIQSFFLWSFMSLCRGRPIEHLSDIRESPLTVNQPKTPFHPAGLSPTRVSLNTSAFLGFGSFEENAREVAELLQEVSLQDITVKHLNVAAIDWQRGLPRLHR